MAHPDPFPEQISIRDKYGPAMTIVDQLAADAYFKRCVDHTVEHWNKSRQEAEDIERSNLGYYAGYYDHATRERVERLFHCAHPFFGPIAEHGPPTPEEALVAGLVAATLTRTTP